RREARSPRSLDSGHGRSRTIRAIGTPAPRRIPRSHGLRRTARRTTPSSTHRLEWLRSRLFDLDLILRRALQDRGVRLAFQRFVNPEQPALAEVALPVTSARKH